KALTVIPQSIMDPTHTPTAAHLTKICRRRQLKVYITLMVRAAWATLLVFKAQVLVVRISMVRPIVGASSMVTVVPVLVVAIAPCVYTILPVVVVTNVGLAISRQRKIAGITLSSRTMAAAQ